MWLDFYARQLGIPRAEALCMPYGELLDLVACYLIHHGLAGPRQHTLDEELFPELA